MLECLVWPPADRPVCNILFMTAPSLLQLETRPRGHGCICTGLVKHPGICPSTLVSNSSGPSQSALRPLFPGPDCTITQAWFPDLVEMLADFPVQLPGVTTLSPNCDCPVNTAPPKLVTWKVSGKPIDRTRFLNELSSSSWLHVERQDQF